MGFTQKQERNGATGSGGEQQSGQTGPIPDVPISQAEAAGNSNMAEGHVMVSTLAGHSVSFDWEAGLAIGEVPGEA
jgi:hypothetical protein